MADILWQLAANLIPTVSGGAYQDIRKVTTEWNARLKHCGPPKIRGSMHPASPSTLFSPIFSLAREKIGPPEARQKRPRRNESLQARLLILCARFFLSKPQTEFAVWVFLCKSATTSQSRLRRASIPTPFVPSGYFPLIGGIGPWKGSLFLQLFPLLPAENHPGGRRGRKTGRPVRTSARSTCTFCTPQNKNRETVHIAAGSALVGGYFV